MEIMQASALVLLPIPLGASAHPSIARFMSVLPGSIVFFGATGVTCLAGVTGFLVGSISVPGAIILCSPLYQVLVISYTYRRFVVKFDREPVDVAFNFKAGLKSDRSLVMGYGLFGLLVPFSLYSWSIWGSSSVAT